MCAVCVVVGFTIGGHASKELVCKSPLTQLSVAFSRADHVPVRHAAVYETKGVTSTLVELIELVE